MTSYSEGKTYPIEEALRAQNALRKLAGLEKEQFPVAAFVGMVSDEIEILRNQGYTHQQIVEAIGRNSSIVITPDYATSEQRYAGNHSA